jgi:hypothetical protein
MVNRLHKYAVRELDKLNENETLSVLDHIADLLSARLPWPRKNPFNDELIISLAQRKENLRARQVVEWEKTRRKGAGKGA